MARIQAHIDRELYDSIEQLAASRNTTPNGLTRLLLAGLVAKIGDTDSLVESIAKAISDDGQPVTDQIRKRARAALCRAEYLPPKAKL